MENKKAMNLLCCGYVNGNMLTMAITVLYEHGN